MLCNVKPVTQGTRYYLELRSPHEQVTLQALTLTLTLTLTPNPNS